jgi:hypothetical protein
MASANNHENVRKVPIMESIELTVPIGEFSVIDFPFKIEALSSTSFMRDLNRASPPIKSTVQIKQEATQQGRQTGSPITKTETLPTQDSISINRGVNALTFFPREFGRVEILVWGGDHPIMIFVVVDKIGEKYYSFFDPRAKDKSIDTFEALPHDRVISDLLKHLYKGTAPGGYQYKEVKGEHIPLNGFEATIGKILVGNRYQAEEWYLKNTTTSNLRIDPSLFYTSGIYSITPERDYLKGGEASRLFVIRQSESKEIKR